MRYRNLLLSALSAAFCLILTSGCRAQQAISPSEGASITWTQSASCTTAQPCPSYLIGRASVASSATACPATTGTTYAVIATVATSNATSYIDNSISYSGYYCYEVQPQQGSPLLTGAASAPSNSGVAVQITEPPLAPGAPTVTETTADAGPAPTVTPTNSPEVASLTLSPYLSGVMRVTVTPTRR